MLPGIKERGKENLRRILTTPKKLKKKPFQNVRLNSLNLRASLTVEASLVIPIFLFSMISLIRLIFLVVFAMRVEMYSDKTLEEYYFLKNATQEEANVPEEETPEMVLRGLLLMHLGEESVWNQHLFFSLLGLDLSFEESSDPNLCIMDIEYSPAILRLPGITLRKKISSRVVSSKWEGRSYATPCEKLQEYYYITPGGMAYHLSSECPNLNLSVRQVSTYRIGEYRNASREKYRKCQECGACDSVCYITDYGEAYHSTPGCTMLRRNIVRVPYEECKGRNLCQKCEEIRSKEHD